MNTEIKFRAYINKDTTIFFTLVELLTNRHLFWLETYDVDRFTGLKDKNGVEIYEGDLCVIVWEASDNKSLPKIIEWQSAAWGFRPLNPELEHSDDKTWESFHVDPFEGDDWNTEERFEVIGNIHTDVPIHEEQRE